VCAVLFEGGKGVRESGRAGVREAWLETQSDGGGRRGRESEGGRERDRSSERAMERAEHGRLLSDAR